MIIILQNSLIMITPLPIIAHTGCMDPTSSTTVMIIDREPIAASSGLSGKLSCEYYVPIIIIVVATNSDKIVVYNYTVGEVTGIIIGVVLIIVGLSIILAIVFTLKLKNDRHQHVKQSLKSQIR